MCEPGSPAHPESIFQRQRQPVRDIEAGVLIRLQAHGDDEAISVCGFNLLFRVSCKELMVATLGFSLNVFTLNTGTCTRCTGQGPPNILMR